VPSDMPTEPPATDMPSPTPTPTPTATIVTGGFDRRGAWG
jgi:hypothetical protein